MLDKQQTYLDHDKKTVCKDTFTNIFSYQVIPLFCKIPVLLSLIRPILGHPLSVKITGFIPLRQKRLWDLMLKVITEPLLYIVTVQIFLFLNFDGLFQDYSRFIRIIVTFFYFVIRDSICTFLALYMDLFMAVVNDVNSVTIAMDSSFSGVRNLQLIIIIFVDCYCCCSCCCLYQLLLSTVLVTIWRKW